MFYRCGPLVATIVVGSDDDSDGSLVWARSEMVFQGGCSGLFIGQWGGMFPLGLRVGQFGECNAPWETNIWEREA